MLRRRTLAILLMAFVIGAGTIPWLVVAQPVDADAVVSGLASTSTQFSITSPDADVTGLDLIDLSFVTIGGVTTQVMRFTMSAATLRGMTLDQACQSSHAVESSVPAADTAILGGPIEVDVTDLSFTYAGTSYELIPGNVIPAGLLPLTGTVSSVSMLGVKLTANTVALTHFSMKVIGC